MTSSKDAHLLSGAYALDAVSAEEAAAVEDAMRSSEELRGEVAELTDTAVVLGLAVPPADPPPALRGRLLDLIDDTPQLPVQRSDKEPEAASALKAEREFETEPEGAAASAAAPAVPGERMPEGAHLGSRRRARRRPVLLLAVAAVAVLLFGGGLAVDRMLQPPSTASTFAQLTAAGDTQRARAAVAGGGTAVVYTSRSLDESAVVLRGVDHPAGRALQMWVITGGTAKSVGLYAPPGGQPYELMKGALGAGQRVAVTVEPPGGSAQPTTKPIVVLPTV